MDDGEKTITFVDPVRHGVYLHIPLFTRDQTVAGTEPASLVIDNVFIDLSDLRLRYGADIDNPHGQEVGGTPPVEGAGRGVGIHDPERNRVDEEHYRPVVLEEGAIPPFGCLDFLPAQGENPHEEREEDRDAEEEEGVIIKFLWDRFARSAAVGACRHDAAELGRERGRSNRPHEPAVAPVLTPFGGQEHGHLPYLSGR